MFYLAITGLASFFTGIFTGLIVFLHSPKKKTNLLWGLHSLSIALWGLGIFIAFSTKDQTTALFAFRWLNYIVSFVPIFFYHFALSFTGRKNKHIYIYYILLVLHGLVSIIFPEFYIPSVSSKMVFLFYPDAGILYIFFPLQLTFFAASGVYVLLKEWKSGDPYKRNQAKYLGFGMLLSFAGGATTFPLLFNIEFYPIGTPFVMCYVIAAAIAIIKYQLMDIRIVISRTIIFTFSFAPVLLLPFFVFYWQQDAMESFFGKKYWIVPTVAEFALTLLGLLAYRYFEKKAERKILQDEYQHERAIKQLTKELITIDNKETLIQKVIHDTKQAANLTSVSLFLQDEREGSMSLHVSPPLDEGSTTSTTSLQGGKASITSLSGGKASTTSLRVSPPLEEGGEADEAISFSPNHPILNYLKQKQDIVLAEELQRNIPDNVSILHQFNAVALVPIMEKTELLGVIVLGEKTNSRVFTQIELLAFKVLAYQIGMQLISITHMEQIKQDIITRESEKATHLQNIIAGISHNLKTPIMSSAGGVSIINDLIKDLGENEQTKEIASWTSDIQENLDYMNNILNGIKQQIIQQQTEDQKPYPLQELIEKITTLMTHEITQNKCTLTIENKVDTSIEITQNINDLLQVLNILISNAVDSYQGKGGEVKLIFSQEKNNFQIKIQDQGKGIPEKVQPSIFKKMVTTKGKHGRGLGLYLIYPIVKGRLNGDITFESIEGKGTRFILSF